MDNMRNLSFGAKYYNLYNKQKVILGEQRGVYFYDFDDNLIFNEPKLRYAERVEFTDEDVCVFTFRSSCGIVLYSIEKREILNRITPRLHADLNSRFVKIHYAFFCKVSNKIIIYAWLAENDSNKNKHEILYYDLKTKKIHSVLNLGVWDHITNAFSINGKYCFVYSYPHEKVYKLYIFDGVLNYKIVDISKRYYELFGDNGVYGYKHINIDIENGLIIIYDWKDSYDGYMYYGDGTEVTAIDLDGNIQPWEPAHRYNEKPQENKKSDIDFETYILKNGIDEFIAKNLSDEELENSAEQLLQCGYNWALEKIEERAKAENIKLYDFTGNEQIPENESILYSVGWLQAEIENGGIEQYFLNGDKKEFDLLIKSLTAIGAAKTAEAIKKGARMIANFNKKENPDDYEYEKLSERFENLEVELTEDYAALAIKYLKEHKN